MKLYYSPASPYVRKVMVMLHEAKIVDRVELIPATGSPIAPGTMPVAHNPLGKIPALEREAGEAIYDSRVICRYIDDLADGRFYPEAPRLWETLTLEATADGILDAAILMIYETRVRPEDMRSAEWSEGQWTKIARALDALEQRWMAHLDGPLDAGLIAVGCALGYLDFRHGDRKWRDGHPKLSHWEKAFAARPSMVATAPPA